MNVSLFQIEIKTNIEYNLNVLPDATKGGNLFRVDKNGKPYFLCDFDIVSDRVSGQINDIRRTIHSQIQPKVYAKMAALVKAGSTQQADGNFKLSDATQTMFKLPRNTNPLGAEYSIPLPCDYAFTDRDGNRRSARSLRFFVIDGEDPNKEFARLFKALEWVVPTGDNAPDPAIAAADIAGANAPAATPVAGF